MASGVLGVVLVVIIVVATVVVGRDTTVPGSTPQPASALPGAATSAPAAPTAQAPILPAQPGQVVVPPDGRVVDPDDGQFAAGGVVGDGQTFAMASYRGGGGPASVPVTVSTYDVSGRPLSSAVDPPWFRDTEGMVISRRADGVSVLFALSQQRTPAQGIVPEQIGWTLTTVDARTLTPRWSAPVRPRDVQNVPPFADATSTTFPSRDGRYVLSTFSDPPVLLDVASGAVVRELPDAVGMIGDSVVVKPNYLQDGGTSVRFTDAVSGEVRSEVTDPEVPSSFGSLPGTWQRDGGGAISSLDGTQAVLTAGYDAVGVRLAGGEAWRVPPPEFTGTPYVFVDSGTGTVLVSRENGYTLTTTGIDPSDGRVLWTQPTTEVCGAFDGRVAAIANEQLVTLDAATGRQLAFDPGTDQCPQMIAGGYSYTAERGIVRFW